MSRTLIRCVAVLVALAAPFVAVTPAQATVHEIVAQWCSGGDELAPPGISGGSNADNVARPLFANGFVGDPMPFEGPQGTGLLVVFNYDHPASKVRGTDVFVAIGQTPAGPLYIELIEPDPSFPAFQRCPRLAG